MQAGLAQLETFFASQGWTPFDYQRRAWRAYLAGGSGLVHAPTGSGKTLSVYGGPLAEALDGRPAFDPALPRKKLKRDAADPFALLWLTPMRALATDTAGHLEAFAGALGLPWTVELRTSDTTSTRRAQQRERLPTVLVTTPESLSLLLSYPDAREKLSASLKCVVVDEWHELLGTKRGTQTELGLARLRAFNPSVRVWGLSATLGNLGEACDVLMGSGPQPRVPELIHARLDKDLRIDTILPASIERFPWAGHMGLRMVDQVVAELDQPGTALVFTNTRAQSELWFRAILERKPEWLVEIAVHHGSLDRTLRKKIEDLLRLGKLRAVVCTSSLDLGVDFAAVDRVLQVGSPKGVARLVQRAGRSGHRPGERSRVLCVPTHAFELVEFSAARQLADARDVEKRPPLDGPLDVLVQHLVTVASGGGFDEDELKAEVRTTHAYRALGDEAWRWAMDFVKHGGASLGAYPRFRRVRQEDGRYVVASDATARLHRLGIGTISGDGVLALVTTGGKKLGTVEEAFVGKLKPGDAFTFAGRVMELVGTRDMTARVRLAPNKRAGVTTWAGSRFPLSTHLSDAVRRRLDEARRDEFADVEMRAVRPVLRVQARWSRIPAPNELLIEQHFDREGTHVFAFAFLGRLVHEGLGAVLAYRVQRARTVPVTATFNDYGVELLMPGRHEWDEPALRALLAADGLADDVAACLNAGELTRRQFREVSRVAGLVLQTSPGAPRSVRQLQASSELFYDVFREFDPGNLLLVQAQREVLDRQLEFARLERSLRALQTQALVVTKPPRLTPMAFPIWAQRVQSQTVRVEDAAERIARMVRRLESAADAKQR